MNVNPKLKTARVELRLTPKQKEKLKALANDSNMSVTDLIITQLQLPAAT